MDFSINSNCLYYTVAVFVLLLGGVAMEYIAYYSKPRCIWQITIRFTCCHVSWTIKLQFLWIQ